MYQDKRPEITKWLPISIKDAGLRGWDEFDVILISGDAYVDHPSFGHAVIGRVIEKEGFRIGIIPQPNWKDDLRDFKKLGRPKLFFCVAAGCMDSMINHYTAAKRLRSDDAYTPGGRSGFRPDRAAIVYSKILKKLYPDVPVIIGGIEASLRRLTHFDYWSNSLKPSVLLESGADILVYGMGEKPIKEILKLVSKGVPVSSLTTLPQTAVLIKQNETLPKNKNWETVQLNSHETCLKDKIAFAKNFKIIETESNKVYAKRIVQGADGFLVVVNPPYVFKPAQSEKEIDSSFDLPYTRLPHPKYNKKGAIPAYEMIKFSVNLHRGCFGGCSFCTISAHQGKFISSRSKESIEKEIKLITEMPGFTGTISDLGGPSANMYKMAGKDFSKCEICLRASCVFPAICKNLKTDHGPLIEIYETASNVPKVKKAFVTSGVRYDLFIGREESEIKKNHCDEYAEELITNRVSGRLKVAPEHTSKKVLKIMRKPDFSLFKKLLQIFNKINEKKKLNQQLVPYFISSHPACTLEDMADTAAQTKEMGFQLRQVQDFTPTPMTLSTVMYHTKINPYTLKEIYCAKSAKEKKEQNQKFFWYKRL
ncbi:MAG: YgiQ family radical SAM protein [Spirochaetia bacterium]|nr:YgiQ family radical SAM protein [Spirochaetia bacterium]